MKIEIEPEAFLPLLAFLGFMMLVCVGMLIVTTVDYILHLF